MNTPETIRNQEPKPTAPDGEWPTEPAHVRPLSQKMRDTYTEEDLAAIEPIIDSAIYDGTPG